VRPRRLSWANAPRGASRPLRLPVPSEEYGAVRKVLEEKKREGLVQTQERILGL
jgi:hypothetical protein